jgi:hypothetical protein
LQLLLQPPQFLSSVAVFVQTLPFSQYVRLPLQVTPHAVPAHTAVPPAGAVHVRQRPPHDN